MNEEPEDDDTDEGEEMPEPRAKRKVIIERLYQPKPEPKKEAEQAKKPGEPAGKWHATPYVPVWAGSPAALKRSLRRSR